MLLPEHSSSEFMQFSSLPHLQAPLQFFVPPLRISASTRRHRGREVLLDFYREHERFHEMDGWTTSVPTRPTQGLMQGCPTGPLMLNSLMALSVQRARNSSLKTKKASLRQGYYLDDRTWWATGKYATAAIKNVVKSAKNMDELMGFEWHPDKGELFSMGRRHTHRQAGWRVSWRNIGTWRKLARMLVDLRRIRNTKGSGWQHAPGARGRNS